MIKPFMYTIPTRIVRCGCRLLDFIHGVQMEEDVILETLALITMNVGQNPIDVKPLVNYDLRDGKCLLVGGNKGLTEFGESVSQY